MPASLLKSAAILAILQCCTGLAGAADLQVDILYVEQQAEQPPVLSGVRPIPVDLGLQGARLGLAEANEGGKFVGQHFAMNEIRALPGENLLDKLAPHLASGPGLIIAKADSKTLVALADLPQAANKLIFNIGAADENLREEDCRTNILHTIPSRAMLTDALAQFLLVKKWSDVLLITGRRSNDQAYADAFRLSAGKFGLTIAADIPWEAESDMRESASTEIPLLTQNADTDAIVVADENRDFGPLIPYNTFYARPVLGTEGLVATGWSDVIETWGARQMQNRFEAMAHRPMQDMDFAGYIALRAIAESVLRTRTSDVAALRNFLLADDLQLSAFKGRGLSFRSWNGQLRQPIHLVTHNAQIDVAPFEQFLHEYTDLDTLGHDQPETRCRSFAR